MFDTNELDRELVIIVATGLLGYARMLYLETNSTYILPTKEDVVREYQNVPVFNRTVDMIVSRLRHALREDVKAKRKARGIV